jgi:YihY family inner membrane protein
VAWVARVPQTRTMTFHDKTADEAHEVLRFYGRLHLVRESFVRFRYGDGFSHSRALALQLVLSLIPLGIALIGLASTLHADRPARVLREVLLRITPGSTGEVVQETLDQGRQQAGHGGQLALWLGLVVALVALTTSMGQVERGANRIYGIQRDRPALQKYGRAVVMAMTAGVLSLVGFVVIIAGGTVGDVLATAYGWQDFGLHLWQALRFPVGVLLAFGAFVIIVENAPRRRQPGWSWVGIGAGVALVLWILFTLALSLYVAHSGSFGSTYGPLTGVMALLLWAYLTSIALFLGVAFAAQLEAVRAGVRESDPGDPEAGRVAAVERLTPESSPGTA